MRSTTVIQQTYSHGGMGCTPITHGAGKPGPKPPKPLMVKTATGWVAA